MVLSEAVVEAARAGDVATVQQWLNAGGDANERCATTGKTLLHFIASDSLRSDGEERGRCDIARLLLALCHRGRAAPTSATPSAFARLIGSAPASKHRTRAAAKIRSSPGLPDPVAHLVCKFWLGDPPRRAKRTA